MAFSALPLHHLLTKHRPLSHNEALSAIWVRGASLLYIIKLSNIIYLKGAAKV